MHVCGLRLSVCMAAEVDIAMYVCMHACVHCLQSHIHNEVVASSNSDNDRILKSKLW